MCLVLDTAHKTHRTTFGVFLEAAKFANYQQFPEIAKKWHFYYRTEDKYPSFVSEYCRSVLSVRTKRRRK